MLARSFAHCTVLVMVAIVAAGAAMQNALATPAAVPDDHAGAQTVTESFAPEPSPGHASSAPMLAGAAWEWRRTERTDDETVVSNDPSLYTVRFLPDGGLSIRADCNQVVGAYVQRGASLSLELGPMTLAACEPGSQDAVFLKDLGEVASYQFYGQDLVLNLRADAGVMLFTRQRPTPLTGTRWRLQAYNDAQFFRSTLIETEITATFGADGTVTGSAGCNTYRGPYTADDGAISVGPLATTRRSCPEPIMVQERAYLAAIERAARYTVAGGLLTVHAADETRLADFVAATAEPQPRPRSE